MGKRYRYMKCGNIFLVQNVCDSIIRRQGRKIDRWAAWVQLHIVKVLKNFRVCPKENLATNFCDVPNGNCVADHGCNATCVNTMHYASGVCELGPRPRKCTCKKICN
ncbi:hypothetical protein PHJA_002533300 [Phtheirospermum japonicum]|uniref:Uncharacterized protein n=1 Tax=Phtheirospermum japonicum TaxID=374723 RepID=A0A830D5V7_9LAMI|nr:hypothetical protein PHJA_002533300 [Phtheirospermum japonicum]